MIVILFLFFQNNLASYVNPFIGTGGHGHTFPGPTTPFGMVQLSPDTRIEGWDACSGYHYNDSTIIGFSHTHLSGTGAIDYGDVLIMPYSGRVYLQAGTESNPKSGYRSSFSHKNEVAKIAYYKVMLDDEKIQVELTADKRSAMHRYRFNRSDSNYVIIDLQHGLGPDKVLLSGLQVHNKRSISGKRISKGWAKEQHLYFYLEASSDLDLIQVFTDDKPVRRANFTDGTNSKALLHLSKNELIIRIGFSNVSEENAKENLMSEINHWSIDKVRKKSESSWENIFKKIQISGKNKDQLAIFYTAMYHSYIHPNILSDVNFEYRRMNSTVQKDKSYQNYSVFSLWDTFRSLHPLYNLISAEQNQHFIRTLLRKYEESDLLPVWELANNETGTMIGYHSVPIIVDAWMKQYRNFDASLALKAMVNSADQNHLGLNFYKRYGFIPADEEHESVSKTLEYAFDDYCIAIFAESLGEKEIADRFFKRSLQYRNLFDPKSSFMRAIKNGKWYEPFSPYEVSGDYTEANAWQYSFFVPHDIKNLIKMHGGDQNFERNLDSLFQTGSHISGRDQPDISGMIGQYAHGNEPSHNYAWLYYFVSKPWKSQSIIDSVLANFYSNQADGLSGNEDCGQMSAWYIWASIGLYPFLPASDTYLISIPKADLIRVNLNGRELKIIRKGKGNLIKSIQWNTKKIDNYHIRHQELAKGGTLVIETTDSRKALFQEKRETAYLPELKNEFLTLPILNYDNFTFRDSLRIESDRLAADEQFSYLVLSDSSNGEMIKGNQPIVFKETSRIAYLKSNTKGQKSHRAEAEFIKIPKNLTIEYVNPYSPIYSAGGNFALVDGRKGGDNFKSSWQGFEGVDCVLTIDLGNEKPVGSIEIGFLQNINSWIFLPLSVEIKGENALKESFPMIKKDYSPAVDYHEDQRKNERYPINKKLRYLKIQIKNTGICPPWHRGAGFKAWLFIDEIKIN